MNNIITVPNITKKDLDEIKDAIIQVARHSNYTEIIFGYPMEALAKIQSKTTKEDDYLNALKVTAHVRISNILEPDVYINFIKDIKKFLRGSVEFYVEEGVPHDLRTPKAILKQLREYETVYA